MVIIKVLSLFDGISCGKLALERAGFKEITYYASEIEKSAIEISTKNHPDIIQLGDINDIDEKLLEELGKIDLVLAGSPCQGFSRNGAMLNFDDPRSSLFFKFVEILNWIRENTNPDVKFLLENVVMKKEWESVITDYVGVESFQINSTLVSAQKRPRLYWTNIEGVNLPDDRGIFLKAILEDNVGEELIVEQEILDSKPVEIKGQLIEKFITEQDKKFIVRNATNKGYLIAEEGDSINLSLPNSTTRRGRVGEGKSNTLDTQCNQAIVDGGRVRRFTITELERLQTLPDGYTEGISDSARKKAIGNGWTVDVIAHILKHIDL